VKIGTTTDSDLHELKFARGVSKVYYLMWAGKEGYEYPRDNFEYLIGQLATSCYESDLASNQNSNNSNNSGANPGVVVLYVFLVLLGLAAVGGLAYAVQTGKLTLPELPSGFSGLGRSRTSPTSSTISLGSPPLSTPRAGLAANDSAQFETGYVAPFAVPAP
jgi:hypothetical protein